MLKDDTSTGEAEGGSEVVGGERCVREYPRSTQYPGRHGNVVYLCCSSSFPYVDKQHNLTLNLLCFSNRFIVGAGRYVMLLQLLEFQLQTEGVPNAERTVGTI